MEKLAPSLPLCLSAGRKFQHCFSVLGNRTQRNWSKLNHDQSLIMIGTKKQRPSEEFWSRKDIVSCHCSRLPYKHVHCPCNGCNFSAVSTSTEYGHWKHAEAMRYNKVPTYTGYFFLCIWPIRVNCSEVHDFSLLNDC